MKLRALIVGLTCAALLALAGSASAAVFQSNGSRDASGFNLAGLVSAEGLGPGGKYVWFVDHLSGEDVLRGYDQTIPGAATPLASIQGTTGVGPGKIGTVTGIGFSPGQNKLYIADNTNNRLIVYPRANDGTANDPVNYAAGISVPSFAQGGGFPVTDPKGLAIDLHGGVFGYASIRDESNRRGLIVFNVAPSGGTLDWHKFVWDPSSWNTTNGPGALTVDSSTGNIYVAEDGLNKIQGYTADIDDAAGTFTSTTPGDFLSLAVDRSSNRLFAAKSDEVEVFSLETQHLLGTTTTPAFNNQNVGFSQLEGSTKFFLSSTGAPNLRDLIANGSPTCTPGPPIDAVAGETTTFTPNCTDADNSAVKEFSIFFTEGESGNGYADPSAGSDSIDYTAYSESLGEDEVSYRVTTQNGLSGVYTQPINVIPPDTTEPTVQITYPTAEATLTTSPATLHYSVSDDRDENPTCNLADGAEVPLDEGDNTITVSCEDDSGNVGTDSVSFTYLPPDTTAPEVAITAPLDGSVLGSDSVEINYEVTDDRDADPSCNYEYGESIPLTGGPNEIELSCEDDAGNVGHDTVNVTYDDEAPTVEITSPSNGDVFNESTATIDYTVTDSVDSEPTCNIPSGSEVSLDLGPNLITVECHDSVGNTSQDDVYLVYDADAPQIEISEPASGALLTSPTTTVNYSVSDDAASEPSCDIESGDSVPLTVGANTIVVNCSDGAGHTGSASVTVTYDAAGPQISIISPTDGSKTDSNSTLLHYTVTDDTDEDPECSRADGASIPLVEGVNTITVSCTDAAEHFSSESVQVTFSPTTKAAAATEPIVHKTANLEPASGQVLVKLPGTDQYIPLSEALLVPVGTIVDARQGTAKLTLANADGTTYEAQFWGGIFQVFQGTGDQPLAIMKLRDDLVGDAARSAVAYPKAGVSPFRGATIARRGKKKNGLWGDGKGNFRTSGKGGSATVRGTKWYVANYENGTYFKVDRGIVNIRPTHGDCFDLKAGNDRFIEYKPLTEKQKKNKSKKKSKPKKGCS